MRIAFIGNPQVVHFRRWVEEFETRGHECAVFAPPAVADDMQGVRLIGGPGGGVLGIARRVLDLRRGLREFRPDVVHAHSALNYGTWAALAGYHPIVLTVWGSDVLRVSTMTRLSAWKVRTAVRGADRVTGDSADLLDAAVALGARREDCVRVVFGVDCARFLAAPRAEADSDVVVLSTRRLEPLYRLDDVIDAFRLVRQRGVRACLRLASYGSQREALERRVVDAGLGHAVEFLGKLTDDELLAEYRAADIYVTVPETDGTAVSLLEAMACGLPVVATDLPANREWLDAAGGDLVGVGDVEAIAAGIDRYAASSELRASAGARNRAVACEHADWSREMDKVEALYGDLRTAERP